MINSFVSIHHIRVLFVEQYPASATNIKDSLDIDEQIICFPPQRNVYFYISLQLLFVLFIFKKKKNSPRFARARTSTICVSNQVQLSRSPLLSRSYDESSADEFFRRERLLNEFSRRLLWAVATRDFCVSRRDDTSAFSGQNDRASAISVVQFLQRGTDNPRHVPLLAPTVREPPHVARFTRYFIKGLHVHASVPFLLALGNDKPVINVRRTGEN